MIRWTLCTTFVSLVAALSIWPGQVSGATIFDNGTPDLSIAILSDFEDGQQVADDFQLLPNASTITGVHWWGAYFNGNTATEPDNFTIRVFADVAGVPAVNPLAEVIVGDVGRADTGLTVGSKVYEYTTAIAPIVLSANTTYWLSIVNDTTADRDDLWYWPVKSSIGNGATRNADGVAWTGSIPFANPELSFSFTGSIVPEPSSLLLATFAIGGLFGIGIWRGTMQVNFAATLRTLTSSRIALCRRLAVSFVVIAMMTASSQAAFVTFESAGADPAAITPTRDAFRAAVGGGSVAGANGSFGGIRREINWDGVPDARADANALPADFFNVTSPRGVVFSTPGTGFLVSANAGQPTATLFGFPSDFQTFSAQRLFTAVNSNVTDISFFVPGTSTVATTTAFAAIFTDVEVAGLTKIEFFDQNSALLYTHDLLVGGNQGLSFLGAVAGAGEQISRVRLTAGLNTIVSNGVLGNPNDDVVVMDDFLYAEPAAVPEPSTLVLAGMGLSALALFRLRKPTVKL